MIFQQTAFFGDWQFFICNEYFHESWPPTRRTRPDKIPVVCFEIVGLFDHESPLVGTPLKTLANTVWTQIRPEIRIRFQTTWNYDVYINLDPARSIKYIFKRSLYKSLQITNTTKYHSACSVDTNACNWHKYWGLPGRDNPVCSATETTCGIDILPEVGLSVTISTDKYAGFDTIAVRSVPLLFVSSRDFLYQRDWNKVFSQSSISHTMIFSKDIVLVLNSTVELAFSPT